MSRGTVSKESHPIIPKSYIHHDSGRLEFARLQPIFDVREHHNQHYLASAAGLNSERKQTCALEYYHPISSWSLWV